MVCESRNVNIQSPKGGRTTYLVVDLKRAFTRNSITLAGKISALFISVEAIFCIRYNMYEEERERGVGKEDY